MATRPRASAYTILAKARTRYKKVLDHPARMVGGGRWIDLAALSDLSEGEMQAYDSHHGSGALSVPCIFK